MDSSTPETRYTNTLPDTTPTPTPTPIQRCPQGSIAHPKTRIQVYLHEVFEALISVIIIFLVTEKNMDVLRILKLSFIIGTITFCIEYYDHEFKQNLKKGMNFSVGGSLIRNA